MATRSKPDIGNKKDTVVFFDVGSTLMHASPSVPEMFALVAQERGHSLTLDQVMPHMAAVDDFYETEYLRDGDFWCTHERAVAIWKDMYRMLAYATGLEGDARGMADAVHARYRQGSGWAVYEDVAPALRSLKAARMRLGVISNWDADLQDLLRQVGLLPYFDEIVSSAVVGCRKPHPQIFRHALERMGADASCSYHVGDLPEADGAAEQVGITPIIIDRSNKHGACGLRRISSLEDLPRVVGAGT